MYRSSGFMMFCLIAAPATMAATAETPGTPTDAADTKHSVRRIVDGRWDVLRRGAIENEVLPLHYQMGLRGFSAKMDRGGVATQVRLKYNGQVKFETRWPSLDGNVSFNVTAEPDRSAVYLLQFRQQF